MPDMSRASELDPWHTAGLLGHTARPHAELSGQLAQCLQQCALSTAVQVQVNQQDATSPEDREEKECGTLGPRKGTLDTWNGVEGAPQLLWRFFPKSDLRARQRCPGVSS